MTKPKKASKSSPRSDASMVSSPMEWPRWPLLPVKHRTRPAFENNYLGAIIADNDFQDGNFKVYVNLNIFGLAGKSLADVTKGLTVEEYPSIEALVVDWKVD